MSGHGSHDFEPGDCAGYDWAAPPEPYARIFKDAFTELERARKLHPKRKFMLHAFSEEAGEVTKAYLEVHEGKAPRDERRKELIQTIAMALRLLTDGDPDFTPVPAP